MKRVLLWVAGCVALALLAYSGAATVVLWLVAWAPSGTPPALFPDSGVPF